MVQEIRHKKGQGGVFRGSVNLTKGDRQGKYSKCS